MTREALAFDMYGTLVDPLPLSEALRSKVGDAAVRVAELWRQKQLEYAFLLTCMQRYEDFERVTRSALDFALAATGQELEAGDRERVIGGYAQLEPFPDVVPGLQRLRDAGYEMVVFSQGTPGMLNPLVESAGLRPYFQDIVSADEVKVFKPAPAVYRHAARRLGRPPGSVWLISGNPFDAAGAAGAGMRVAKIERTTSLRYAFAPPPDLVAADLLELAHKLTVALE